MNRSELEIWLRDYLDTDPFRDYCVNGLQVEGNPEVKRAITGVSVSERLFRRAIDLNADTIFVHHGLFWKNSPHPLSLRGILKSRVELLIKNDINLFGYHLPLDCHPEIGNNILLANTLGLDNPQQIKVDAIENFSAVLAELPEAMRPEHFRLKADRDLDTRGLLLDSGKDLIRKIYIMSGGGGGYFEHAVEAGADLMITGELTENSVRSAEESGLALYAAGHYNSEKLGITALGEKLKTKFKIETKFIDIPNPV